MNRTWKGAASAYSTRNYLNQWASWEGVLGAARLAPGGADQRIDSLFRLLFTSSNVRDFAKIKELRNWYVTLDDAV
jgi:hypothetical protein